MPTNLVVPRGGGRRPVSPPPKKTPLIWEESMVKLRRYEVWNEFSVAQKLNLAMNSHTSSVKINNSRQCKYNCHIIMPVQNSVPVNGIMALYKFRIIITCNMQNLHGF